MMRVFMCLRKRLPVVVPKLFFQQPRGNDGSSIEIRGDCVVKRCRPAPLMVYEALKLPSPLPCAVTITMGRSAKNGMVRLEIRPVCLEQLPSTVEELRAALRCVLTALGAFHARGFVHRDVRWPNVLKSEEQWLLADFELADRAGSLVPEGAIASAHLPPEVSADGQVGYTMAGDVYCVGKLVKDWEQRTGGMGGVLPPAACGFRSSLMGSDPGLRPTASQLLAQSWVSA
jgi:serine/threonine protein kinase